MNKINNKYFRSYFGCSTLFFFFLIFSSNQNLILAQIKLKLPAVFKENKVYVKPVTIDGDTLCFDTDTGGGQNIIYPSAVERLNLKKDSISLGNRSGEYVILPEFESNSQIPLPKIELFNHKFLVFEPHPFLGEGMDGFLAATWFRERIWEIDYLQQNFSIYNSYQIDSSRRNVVDLGFPKNEKDEKIGGFPRITVEIDGDSLDLLFDTGATLLAKDSVANLLNSSSNKIGTSFISESIFKKWKENNPEWKVIENAEQMTEADIIQVPEVEIAGFPVGPVWFTVRPDKNFTEWMSQWMDKEIVGALGGSALKFFRVLLHYPEEKALFYSN